MTLLKDMEKQLGAAVVGRKALIRSIMRAALAQEHIFIKGDPGTAKSMLIESFLGLLEGSRGFVELMNKFTTPKETLGPEKVSSFKNDENERNLIGHLGDCHYALLDEFFKGSSAIINATLRMMQERRIGNGVDMSTKTKRMVDTPLRMILAASNEVPEPGMLDAAYDRFLVRCEVDTLKDRRLIKKMCFGGIKKVSPVGRLEDMDLESEKAMQLPFTTAAQEAYLDMLSAIQKDDIHVGNRRQIKSLKLAQAEAHLCGAPEVAPEHLCAVADSLWSRCTKERNKVKQLVLKHTNPDKLLIEQFTDQLDKYDAEPSDLTSVKAKRIAEITDMVAKTQNLSESTDKTDLLRRLADTQANIQAIAISGGSSQVDEIQQRLQDRVRESVGV